MTPGEIRACYRLYAAHRKSHEICAFPGTIPAASNAGNLDDLAVFLAVGRADCIANHRYRHSIFCARFPARQSQRAHS